MTAWSVLKDLAQMYAWVAAGTAALVGVCRGLNEVKAHRELREVQLGLRKAPEPR